MNTTARSGWRPPRAPSTSPTTDSAALTELSRVETAEAKVNGMGPFLRLGWDGWQGNSQALALRIAHRAGTDEDSGMLRDLRALAIYCALLLVVFLGTGAVYLTGRRGAVAGPRASASRPGGKGIAPSLAPQ